MGGSNHALRVPQSVPPGRSIPAGTLLGLSEEIALAEKRFGLPDRATVMWSAVMESVRGRRLALPVGYQPGRRHRGAAALMLAVTIPSRVPSRGRHLISP